MYISKSLGFVSEQFYPVLGGNNFIPDLQFCTIYISWWVVKLSAYKMLGQELPA